MVASGVVVVVVARIIWNKDFCCWSLGIRSGVRGARLKDVDCGCRH